MDHKPKFKNEIKLLEENIDVNLFLLFFSHVLFSLNDDFFDTTQKAHVTKNINKLDFFKTNNFCHLKSTIKKMKR